MIKIDPEFEALIPPLTADEFRQLEENCVAEGIRDPLVVWSTGKSGDDDILIDGHNRFKISAEHGGMIFTTKRIMFKDRDEVKAWIIQNQFGRRNLSAFDRSVLALRLKPLLAKEAKAKQVEGGKKKVQQKSVEATTTQKELAKIAGVSHDTIHKVEKIEAEASEETKKKLRKGDITINHAFNNLPSQRNKDIVKEATRQAQKEHIEYMEQKASGIVNIESAKKEKSNMRLLSLEASKHIHKLVSDALVLPCVVSDEALRNLGESMKDSEYIELESNLREVSNIITKIRKELSKAHGKR